MKKPKFKFFKDNLETVLTVGIFSIFIVFLLLYLLGSITHNLAFVEFASGHQIIGLTSSTKNTLYLPLKIIRTIVFALFGYHKIFFLRAPSAILGGLTIVSFYWIIRLWFDNRTAIFGTIIFAGAAWTLHVARLASYDIVYLWAITSLILAHVLLYLEEKNIYVWLFNCLIWSLAITIPGLIWLVIIDMLLQKKYIKENLSYFNKFWQRLLSFFMVLICLALSLYSAVKFHLVRSYIGLPEKFSSPLHIVKDYLAVYVHLFIRGPEHPSIWLGRAPLLDMFGLILAILGIYFYALNYHHNRSKLLLIFFLVCSVLTSLNGPVSFSLMVPFMYILVATGIAYLIQNWFKVFPKNPFARTFGIVLISLAIMISFTYNYRAYFVAWRYSPVTKTTFIYPSS